MLQSAKIKMVVDGVVGALAIAGRLCLRPCCVPGTDAGVQRRPKHMRTCPATHGYRSPAPKSRVRLRSMRQRHVSGHGWCNWAADAAAGTAMICWITAERRVPTELPRRTNSCTWAIL
jgi:hypothetical protein